MVNKFKSLIPLPAIVIAFAILFFGSPASKANAQVAFQAQFATPVGSFGVPRGPLRITRVVLITATATRVPITAPTATRTVRIGCAAS